MNITASQVEDAMIDALSPLLEGNGGKARLIASYGGQFEKAVEGASQIRLIMPAILVTHSGSVYDPACAPSYDRIARFRVYHASASQSSEFNRRREAMELMEAARAILNGSTLSLAITPLVVENESLVQTGAAVCVYAADYKTSAIDTAA